MENGLFRSVLILSLYRELYRKKYLVYSEDKLSKEEHKYFESLNCKIYLLDDRTVIFLE